MFLIPVIHERNILTILTINAPQTADQNPSICKPRLKGPESAAVTINIKAFTIRVKRPSVSMIKGRVKSIVSGFRRAFTIPKIMPIMIIFHHAPVNVIPSTIFIAAAIERALIITLSIKYAMLLY